MHLHPETTVTAAAPAPPASITSRVRGATRSRRLLWASAILAVVVLLILGPPFLSVNRYRNQIARSMGESLGRPVHLDNVSLHLLPVPGFTLQNLVVSEDPAFGAEPTIRANTVEARLRLSSLWRRPIEFSTVRFVEPSVNLVRDPDGHWNLASVLLHASRVNTAPTGERRTGSAPRFPYIEATGGRVNIKFGDEKLPFSLTEADFALWLPSPQVWKVRLIGHPARTDTYVTESGTLRLEGQLKRASTAAEVPVSFRGSWHDVPMGEATRILTGEDRGWRGSLNLDTTLEGPLGDAALDAMLTLGSLRRADFVPARTLDLQMHCNAGLTVEKLFLHHLDCGLPVDAPAPIRVQAERVELQRPQETVAAVQASAIPMRYALLWAALFSPRVRSDLRPTGSVDVALRLNAAPEPMVATVGRHRSKLPAAPPPGRWSGQVTLHLPVAGSAGPPADGSENTLSLQVTTGAAASPELHLPPSPVRLGPDSSLTVSGGISPSGYTLSAQGVSSPAAVLLPSRYLPQLGDGLETVLPFPPVSLDPLRLNFTCRRNWTSPQTCSGPQQAGPVPASPGLSAGSPVQPANRPNLLTPRNLSPLEDAPFTSPKAQSAPQRPF